MLNWLYRLYFENISLWGYAGGVCSVPLLKYEKCVKFDDAYKGSV